MDIFKLSLFAASVIGASRRAVKAGLTVDHIEEVFKAVVINLRKEPKK